MHPCAHGKPLPTLDHYYCIFFGVMFLTFFAVALVSVRAESQIEKRKQAESGRKSSWWRKYFFPMRLTAAEFRAAGYVWLVPSAGLPLPH
jgi:hypothetical protein